MILLILLFVSSLFKGENAFAMWKKEHKNKKQTHHKGMCNAGISSSYCSRLAAQPTTLIKYKRGAKCSTKNINTIMIFCCFCLHCLFYSLFMAASLLYFFPPPQRFKKFLEFIRTEILLSFNLILNFQNHKHLISYPQTFFFNYTFAFVHTPTANIKCLANIVRIHVNSYQPQNNYNLETWQCNFVVTLKLKEKNVLIAHHQLVIA